VARYFAFDYAFVVSCKRDPTPHISLLAYGPEDERPEGTTEGVPLDRDQFRSQMGRAKSNPELEPMDPGPLAPALAVLTKTSVERLDLKSAVVVPTDCSPTSATFVVMGRWSGGFSIRDMTDIDRQAFHDILGALSMVVKVARLVQDLEYEVGRHAGFLLDVAHDIRNPIQNIVLKAERLRRGLFGAEGPAYHAKRIATQVKRLHLLSERVWTLDQVERGKFEVDRAAKVQIYDVLKECSDSLGDLAAQRSVTISIDPKLQDWPALRIDKAFLAQALLNLLDNAVKYSRKGNVVRINGKEHSRARDISVVSQGVPIFPHEHEIIFEKFHSAAEPQPKRRQ
jgi:signal transduction histidine kinase